VTKVGIWTSGFMHACRRDTRLRAEAAARRAVQVGDHTYQGVKRTLTLGLDLAHVPAETPVQRDAAARSAATFCASASGR